MMNKLAKALVLLQVTFSIVGMTWAIMLVLVGRDLGWKEPRKEVVEYTKDGKEKIAFRHASEYDKSVASLKDAVKIRDLTLIHVKPALDSIRNAEPYLSSNHLFFLAERERLRSAPGDIDVTRFANVGFDLDVPILGKPMFDAKKLDMVNKSYKTYQEDLKKIYAQVDDVEKNIRDIVIKTKKFTEELTGTDEDNKYVQPGLYQLTDLEYKAQTQLKAEIDDIKPQWSKALEQARLFLHRRVGLEESLQKLEAPLPKNPKK